MIDVLRRLWPNRAGPIDWPTDLQGYALAKRRFDRGTPIDRVRFVVFDTETTGLDPKQDRLLSIAGIGLRAGLLVTADSFEATVRQDGVGGAEAAAVHGLVRRDLAGGLDEAAAVVAFLHWARDAVLVGQHVAFDVAVLDAALARLVPAGAVPPRVWNPRIDTEHLARRVRGAAMGASAAHGASEDSTRRHSLDALLEAHGLDTVDRHTAAGDAMATAELFQRLCAHARARGVRTLKSLLRTPTR